jgi:D-alanyl-D-alanine carboxypeptidase
VRRCVLAGAILVGAMLAPAVARSGAAAQSSPSPVTFDAIVERAAHSSAAPGIAIAVVHGGQTVYARGIGWADIARGVKVTPQTRFAIGSLTKQITAAAILQLRDAGKLSLDDKLARYFPALPNASTITLRMLLSQISGLHNYPNTTEHPWPLTGTIDPQRILAFLAADKPDFAPGTRYEYSNTNYAVLAAVIEHVSGMPYGDYVEQKIFAPLGMTQSGNGYIAQRDAATPYVGTQTFTPATPLISLDLFYGAGSVVSTAEDLARWDTALLRGTLLGPASMHDLWMPGALPDAGPIAYAMGLVPSSLNGHREVWHNGYAPNAGGYCYNAMFPDDDLAVVVLTNGAAFDGQADAIVRAVLEAYYPPAHA